MDVLRYLSYLWVAAEIIKALATAQEGESVTVPPIKGIRAKVKGKTYSYTLQGELIPE